MNYEHNDFELYEELQRAGKDLEELVNVQREYEKLSSLAPPIEVDMSCSIEKDNAIFRTADATESVNNKFDVLSQDLETERQERREADAENLEYTKKIDKRNFIVAVIAAATGVAALIVSIIALVK